MLSWRMCILFSRIYSIYPYNLDIREDYRITYRDLEIPSENSTKRKLGYFYIANFSWEFQNSERSWGLLCSLEIKCLLCKTSWEADFWGFPGCWRSVGVRWSSFIFLRILGRLKTGQRDLIIRKEVDFVSALPLNNR